ncbi:MULTISPECIES: hypothetical protein [Marinobacter]|jgi:hypothetical protein|uniref:hypothetical protein n=1 Tax=Marinobacter TaxID=2742 RepID=UPI000948A960|nr:MULTISPECIES: hypothetical protein [Marinobacter]OLF85749.1 hypothetical protein AWH63_01930 [Marinobacter sp. C18]|tara:strand:- start:2962 stop:3705 length:744 start_codon:yes stop_codon:yes gene_type:complete
MVEVRRLNERGIEAFENYISGLSNDGGLTLPLGILTDDRTSEPLDIELTVNHLAEFATRYDMGVYLVDLLKQVRSQQLLGDSGFWTWLALCWFDQLCPLDSKGKRKPKKPYNYVLSPNWNHRPRHALYTTWMLVANHRESARFMLSKKPSARGELIEQLAARQYFMSCRGVIEAAHRIYFDSSRGTFKVGSTSQTRGGNIRRFVSYLQQLDLTYDLGTITADSLMSILPYEYNRFLDADSIREGAFS